MTNPEKTLIPYKKALIYPVTSDVLGAGDGNPTFETAASNPVPEILFITSYPPRECGIATYSQDLITAIKAKFGRSFSLKVCALEGEISDRSYPPEVKYTLQTSQLDQYVFLAAKINSDNNVALVFIQHEFGLYGGDNGAYLINLLSRVKKPIATALHTVLPKPDARQKKIIKAIEALSTQLVVMTKNSADILEKVYKIPKEKIVIIPHGTHLVSSFDRNEKKAAKHLGNRLILTTFGLLSSGKSIETALDALPSIVEEYPNVLYLIIGKTHPSVVKQEGENYRDFLYQKVMQHNLQNNVRFINKYLSLEELLEYLQLTDIYLFTSKDPYQAVSGTFAYAMGCGCPVISTPIPHATELLDGAGLIVGFKDSKQLASATISLLSDPGLLNEMRLNALHRIRPSAWQNAAISHAELIQKSVNGEPAKLNYSIPDISMEHIRRLTTKVGMIQFSCISVPDLQSGYTLDDNARALISVSQHYETYRDPADLMLIETYLNFIVSCQQPDGRFLNYVDIHGEFFEKNSDENLEDSNGRGIWALGMFVSMDDIFDEKWIDTASLSLQKAVPNLLSLSSPRAVAFAIKGLYLFNLAKSPDITELIVALADNLVSKYNGVADQQWKWFEEYLTYANSVLPEALICAYLATENLLYKNIAKSSFDFLLSVIFQNGKIRVVSNQGWHLKGKFTNRFGEQPIDVAYTILALGVFYDTFKDNSYLKKMESAFNWFQGDNHLHRIVYNPCTGGCCDGLEETHVNLNEGAESTVSYLMARLTVGSYLDNPSSSKPARKAPLELVPA